MEIHGLGFYFRLSFSALSWNVLSDKNTRHPWKTTKAILIRGGFLFCAPDGADDLLTESPGLSEIVFQDGTRRYFFIDVTASLNVIPMYLYYFVSIVTFYVLYMYLFSKMRHSLSLIVGGGIVASMMLSCQDSPVSLGEQAANFQTMTAALSAESTLAEVSYEIESTTRILPNAPSDETPDLITMVPQITNERVTMMLTSSGETSWIIETLTPSQNIYPDHESLPNNQPIPTKIVYADGKMSLYDKDGVFIQAHETPIPSASHLVETILSVKEQYSTADINQAILNMQTQGYNSELLAMIANPSNYGATVSELGNGISSISMSSSNTGIETEEGEIVILVDTNRNLMLATRLYDVDGNPLSSVMIEYEQGSSPHVKGILQQVADELPSGQSAIMETYCKISNLSVTIN